ncbi:DgyrCDS8619 [Dimorphilus gyrociliatus]|uniref:DgyrCDS8619 n=1 Tax=Dimorphilus gyrociliatus TaxID=2664684 RepID=A0A7I8VVQ2_9ANNE|nr:DgyrCDS8619 [Dimorphilus gyrociliatus]
MTSADSVDAKVKEEISAVDRDTSDDHPSLHDLEKVVENYENNHHFGSGEISQLEQSYSRPDSLQESHRESILRDETSTFRDSRAESFPPVPDFIHMETINSPEQNIETSVQQQSYTVNTRASIESPCTSKHSSTKELNNTLESERRLQEEATYEANNNEKAEAEKKRHSGLYDGYTQDIIEQNTLELGPDMPRGETEDSSPEATKKSNAHNFSCKRLCCGFIVIFIGIAIGLGVSLGLKESKSKKESSTSPQKSKQGIFIFNGNATIQGEFGLSYDTTKDQKFIAEFCGLVEGIESKNYRNVKCQVTDITKGSAIVSFLLQIISSHNDGAKFGKTLENVLKEEFKESNMNRVSFAITFVEIKNIQTSKKPNTTPTTKSIPMATSSHTTSLTENTPARTKPMISVNPTSLMSTEQTTQKKSEFTFRIESLSRNLTEVIPLRNSSFFEHMKALAEKIPKFK